MGLACYAKIIAGVKGQDVYRKEMLEIEVIKKDKYGNKYMETSKVEVERFGPRTFGLEDDSLYEFLDMRNIEEFNDGELYGIEILDTGSHRHDGTYALIDTEALDKGLYKAKKVFSDIGISDEKVKLYLVNELSY